MVLGDALGVGLGEVAELVPGVGLGGGEAVVVDGGADELSYGVVGVGDGVSAGVCGGFEFAGGGVGVGGAVSVGVFLLGEEAGGGGVCPGGFVSVGFSGPVCGV